MGNYFASVQFVIEAESEVDAEEVQRLALDHILGTETIHGVPGVIDAHADERVELDEFGHAG